MKAGILLVLLAISSLSFANALPVYASNNARDELCGKAELGMMTISSECSLSKQQIQVNPTDFNLRILHGGTNRNPALAGQRFSIDIRGCKLNFNTTKTGQLILTGKPERKLAPGISIDVNATGVIVYEWEDKYVDSCTFHPALNITEPDNSTAPSNTTELDSSTSPSNSTAPSNGTDVSIAFSEPFSGIKIQISPFESKASEAECPLAGSNDGLSCNKTKDVDAKNEVTEEDHRRFWHSVPRYVWIIIAVVIAFAFVIPGLVLCSYCICPCILFCLVVSEDDSESEKKPISVRIISSRQ